MASTAESARDSRSYIDDRHLLFLPAGLVAAFLAVLFLPKDVAADLVVQLLVLFLVLIAVTDAVTRKVPNVLVFPSIAFALASTAVVDFDRLDEALIGGAGVIGIMIVLAVIQRGAMGMGDVKLACLGGCILGFNGGLFSLLFGFVGAGAVALPIILLKIRKRRDYMPLAPFLVFGMLLASSLWGFVLDGDLGIPI